jgi:hypothetical protein
MKKGYDFSKGERGKFYRKDTQLNIPVYLDSETLSLVMTIAERQNTDVSTLVDKMVKMEIGHIDQAK